MITSFLCTVGAGYFVHQHYRAHGTRRSAVPVHQYIPRLLR
ncbi:MAG TPA: hypothetical protein VNG51_26450 [Ktedonobacteraceae bacterium]|nr:hypothetical protein [Ktedonobacteraceae bacterium]